MPKAEAYDMARREFYALRQEEEIERRIAKEEAQHVGAYFGKTRLEIGHMLEGKEFDRWKTWAATEIEKQKAMRSEAESAGSAATTPDAPVAAGPTHDIAQEA